MDEQNKKKNYTPGVALVKGRSYCAYQERCQQEVRNKLYEWGLYPKDVENIIAKLIVENFLNEERFAKQYAGGKFRIKKWGRVKIKIELKRRNISDYCIRQAMKEIDDKNYFFTLKKILLSKLKNLPAGKTGKKSKFEIHKAGRFAIGKGYESDIVWDVLRDVSP